MTSVKRAPNPGGVGLMGGAQRSARSRAAHALAAGALVAGLGYAAISTYWAVGGRRLLATVGGEFERLGHSRGAAVILGLWAVVVLKAVAAALPAVSLQLPARGWGRTVSALAWIAAVILTVYGLVLTLVGVMVQADLTHAGAGADHRALAWHAYLWDLWFLLWGVLAKAARICGRVPFPIALRRAPTGR